MSIKDLFDSRKSSQISKSQSTDDLVQTVESRDFVESKRKEFEQFSPPIDFSTASNFAKFGSAELYYAKSFERIHQYFPYDGTLAEKTEFNNSSSYLDKYVFENLYPRSNGYVTFNGVDQYITVQGGPHTASAGMIGETLDSTFDFSSIYDPESGREGAFDFDPTEGFAIEFWMKKTANATAPLDMIFDCWNGETNPVTNGRIQVYVDAALNDLSLEYVSGAIGISMDITASVTSPDWNHFAVSIKSDTSGTEMNVFKNGVFEKTESDVSQVGRIRGISSGINAAIGTLSGPFAIYTTGDGLSQISLDEFRFWKKARTPEQVYNNWFQPLGGGTNKNDANLDLGLYYKFNEGITTDTSIDSFALDYSGRMNNGSIVGYVSSLRSTSSAITEALGELEWKDPIVYSSHPDVVSKKAEMVASGSLSDISNTSMLYRFMPSWMQESDEQSGGQMKNLCQVMASQLDTVWHQIDFLDKIHDKRYIGEGEKPLPFAKQILENEGFFIPNLFSNASILENLRGKADSEMFAEAVEDVRNTIYQNIYNNINSIYKTKGTEKSFRNLFNSIGIGQNVVKLNKYADDSTFVLRDNYELKSFEKRFLDFNAEGNRTGTIYSTSSAGNIYIPGDTNYLGSMTYEAEIILPEKPDSSRPGYNPFGQLSASVYGFHSGQTYTTPSPDYGLTAYVVHERLDSSLLPGEKPRAKFVLTGSSINIESDWFIGQYNTNKWNLAIRLKHENYPRSNVSGNVVANYFVEFSGVEAEGNNKKNSFHISSSISAATFTSDKVFYAGANRTNVVGSVLYESDVKLGSVRYWHSYLSDDAIDRHAYDPSSFGANNPQENDLVDTYAIETPREKTLSFHWAFDTLTGSAVGGDFEVADVSSGSATTTSDYGSLSDTIQRSLPAHAINFSTSSTTVFSDEFLFSAIKRRPSDLMSSDLVTIKNDETRNFFVDDDVSDNFYSFEKSMYASISDEMMKMFSTALDFNNLIGQPNQKYHHKYNMLDFLRDRFFDDVENDPDIEKFTSFYKWIDDSISVALNQLVPAGTRFSGKIDNVIESHVLERSKYVHQFPIMTTYESTEGSIKGISEMKYDWEHGHAPLANVDEEQNNVLWQQDRKVKTGLREDLRVSRNNHSIQSSGLLRKEIGGATRISDTYAIRRFAKIYDVAIVSQSSLHAGINFSREKNLSLFHESVAPAGVTTGPDNIITIGVGSGDGINRGVRNDDITGKRMFSATAKIESRASEEYGYEVKSDSVLPMNLVSGTVHSGYNNEVMSFFASDVIVSNLHHDSYGRNNEAGIQGPFTNSHVGGLQYRHIDINTYDSTKTVDVVTRTGESYSVGSIDVLNLGTLPYGTTVTVVDADGTSVTALYSGIYDLYDAEWTNVAELKLILEDKMNLSIVQTVDKLDLTQDTIGSSFNTTITTTNAGITVIGFSGGVAGSLSTTVVNLDGPSNRPEGWKIVFGEDLPGGDTDGAMGFVGPDYDASYPDLDLPRAFRYREETAKRPVNIRNIKTSTTSQKVGNYSNAIQLFSVAPEHQKTWAIEANEDPSVDILPPVTAGSLPETTHYQTLISRGPLHAGNVFGQMNNNRQIDSSLTEIQSLALNSADTTENFRMASSTSIAGYSGYATGNKSLSFWVNLDNETQTGRYVIRALDAGANESFSLLFSSSSRLYYRVTGAGGTRTWYWNISYAFYANAWNHIVISWDGNTSNAPTLFSNGGSGIAAIALAGPTGITTIYAPSKIYLLDDGATSHANYELQGSLQNFGIYSTLLNQAAAISIYNGGISLDTPVQTSDLYDFWKLGNGNGALEIGTPVSVGTIFSSSFGGTNALTSSGGVAIVAGNTTPTRWNTPYLVDITYDNVIATPRTDLTGSQRNINTRFSSPGGPEVQTLSFLDCWSQTYAANNALPFRNMTILADSGEVGTIRINDHLGHRRGLRTLRTLHQGRFGIDATYGSTVEATYSTNGSFNKQHRNSATKYVWNGETDITASLLEAELITSNTYDNAHINSMIPSSEFQYSWIRSGLTGSGGANLLDEQIILGYSPVEGRVSSSVGMVDAIVFQSGSTIFGS